MKLKFLEIDNQIYMGQNISLDGGSRSEDIEALKGISSEKRAFETGFPLIQALEEQQEQQEGKKHWWSRAEK